METSFILTTDWNLDTNQTPEPLAQGHHGILAQRQCVICLIATFHNIGDIRVIHAQLIGYRKATLSPYFANS